METTNILLALIALLIIYIIMWTSARHKHWKKNGVAYLKPIPVVGNILEVLCLKKSIGEIYKEAYFNFPNEKVVGVYEFYSPVLIIKDPKLIEKILIKDFQYFADRSTFSDEHGLFAYGLFQLKGPAWRSIRQSVSPTFTSGKLKGMFEGMLECTDEMMSRISANLNKDYEIRDALAAYTTDVIANTVFGIQINNKQAREEFAAMGTEIFDTTPIRFINVIALAQFPKLANKLGISLLRNETTEYFKGLIKTALSQRENANIQRNDYTQQLLKLKHSGVIEFQSKDEDDDYLRMEQVAAPDKQLVITDDVLAGQAFQFLSAGFDPLLAITLYVFYLLSLNPEPQERARQHIKETLKKHNGYSFDCVKDMTYLDQCIQETLRIHPIVAFLFRDCTKKYKVPGTDLELLPGHKVIIPITSLHMDPQYYPDPEKFIPERFPPNTLKQNFTYLPFGDGPRICIGVRYAMIVMKLALAKILTKYKVSLSPQTKRPFNINKQSILMVPKGKILFQVMNAAV